MIRKFFGCFLLMVILASCITKKKTAYFQEREKGINEYTPLYAPHHIKAGDQISVEIRSLNPSSANFFNFNSENKSQPYNSASIFMNNYMVNDSGYIKLPILGIFGIKGLKIHEAEKIIQDSINRHLTNATVFLKLINFEIALLGEVNRPGNYQVYADRISLPKALAMAGDLTIYGKRTRIKIIREHHKSLKVHYCDLTDPMFMQSEYYYLMPDDVVYVEAATLKYADINLSPYRTVFLGISSILVLLRLIKII